MLIRVCCAPLVFECLLSRVNVPFLCRDACFASSLSFTSCRSGSLEQFLNHRYTRLRDDSLASGAFDPDNDQGQDPAAAVDDLEQQLAAAVVESGVRAFVRPPDEVLEPLQAKLRAFRRCSERLHLGWRPADLPCREVEFQRIYDFLQRAMAAMGSGRPGAAGTSLYVCGMPGTGKTATVYQAVRRLYEEASYRRAAPVKGAWSLAGRANNIDASEDDEDSDDPVVVLQGRSSPLALQRKRREEPGRKRQRTAPKPELEAWEPFVFVELNGMDATSADAAYAAILQALTGTKVSRSGNQRTTRMACNLPCVRSDNLGDVEGSGLWPSDASIHPCPSRRFLLRLRLTGPARPSTSTSGRRIRRSHSGSSLSALVLVDVDCCGVLILFSWDWWVDLGGCLRFASGCRRAVY